MILMIFRSLKCDCICSDTGFCSRPLGRSKGKGDQRCDQKGRKKEELRTQWCSIFVTIIIYQGDNVRAISFHDIEPPDAMSIGGQRITNTNFRWLMLPPVAALSTLVFLGIELLDVVIWEWLVWVIIGERNLG